MDTWEELFDWEKLIIDSILPDEEDLTKSLPDVNGNSYLSLKDRAYNPEDFSGLGRIILRKNIVEVEDHIYGKVKKNVLYQDMINKENTIYEIRYDFDLNGKEITIPEGCMLDFQGGSFNNGVINFNNTYLKGKITFNDINNFTGTILNKHIEVNWFGLDSTGTEDVTNKLLNISTICNSADIIYFSGTYKVSNNCFNITKDSEFGDISVIGYAKFILTSNFNGDLFYIQSGNVRIDNIHIVGTDSSQDQYDITDFSTLRICKVFSFRGLNTVNVSNVSIDNIWGNGFTLTWGYSNITFTNINLNNVGGRIEDVTYDSHGDAIYFNFKTWKVRNVPTFVNIDNFKHIGKTNGTKFSRSCLNFELLSTYDNSPTTVNLNVNNLYVENTNQVIHYEHFDNTKFLFNINNSLFKNNLGIIFTAPSTHQNIKEYFNLNNCIIDGCSGAGFLTKESPMMFWMNGGNLILKNCNIKTNNPMGQGINLIIENTTIEGIIGWWLNLGTLKAFYSTFIFNADLSRFFTSSFDNNIFDTCVFKSTDNNTYTINNISVTPQVGSTKFKDCIISNISGISNEIIYGVDTRFSKSSSTLNVSEVGFYTINGTSNTNWNDEAKDTEGGPLWKYGELLVYGGSYGQGHIYVTNRNNSGSVTGILVYIKTNNGYKLIS